MDEGVRRVGTVIVRTATLFLGLFLFGIHVVATGPTKPRLIHVFAALADNQHQSIAPVPAKLLNADDPARNLYWGAAFEVRNFFRKNPEWKEIASVPHPKTFILERSIFQEKADRVLLVADAYRGNEIKQALTDFRHVAAGVSGAAFLFGDRWSELSNPLGS